MITHEQAYGVIVVFHAEGEKDYFLILQHKDAEGSWSFPKGHHEEGESPRETALRELAEEAGITDIKIIDTPLIHEEYEINHGSEKILKKNDYFIGFTKSKEVKIQEGEISAYKWATQKEALETFQYESRKNVLTKALEYLK